MQAAAQSGMLVEVCAAIAGCLDELQARNTVTNIGFVTYHSAVHFYNLNSSLSAAQARHVVCLCFECFLLCFAWGCAAEGSSQVGLECETQKPRRTPKSIFWVSSRVNVRRRDAVVFV